MFWEVFGSSGQGTSKASVAVRNVSALARPRAENHGSEVWERRSPAESIPTRPHNLCEAYGTDPGVVGPSGSGPAAKT